MESSSAVRKVSLKSCQFGFFLLSLRRVSQRISSNNSLNIWKLAILKFRLLTLIFARPIFLEIMNSTKAWSLQPRFVVLQVCVWKFCLLNAMSQHWYSTLECEILAASFSSEYQFDIIQWSSVSVLKQVKLHIPSLLYYVCALKIPNATRDISTIFSWWEFSNFCFLS